MAAPLVGRIVLKHIRVGGYPSQFVKREFATLRKFAHFNTPISFQIKIDSRLRGNAVSISVNLLISGKALEVFDEILNQITKPISVIPAKAGIQLNN
jgi:hypothetical protein